MTIESGSLQYFPVRRRKWVVRVGRGRSEDEGRMIDIKVGERG